MSPHTVGCLPTVLFIAHVIDERIIVMQPYIHTVQYYETDKMGIVHHSNYIRWMEEARVDYLEKVGWSYDKLEKMGIVSPVTSVTCNYKASTTFADVISVSVALTSFNGVTLKISYEMRNADDKIVCTAQSEHVFLNEKGMFIRLHREYPDLYAFLCTKTENKTS